jgi:hypothetical protein
MTKRLVCIFAVLALLCTPALAEYKAVLKGNVQTTFNLTASAANFGSASATICFSIRIPGLAPAGSTLPICQNFTLVPNANKLLILPTLPLGTTRITIQFDVPNGGIGAIVMQILQSPIYVNEVVINDGFWVYDVQ